MAPEDDRTSDAKDLEWLEMRAQVTAEYSFELQRKAEDIQKSVEAAEARKEDTADQVKALSGLISELAAAVSTAIEAKQALDDAYAAQAIMLPATAPDFDSDEERNEWIRLMRAEAIQAALDASEAMETI